MKKICVLLPLCMLSLSLIAQTSQDSWDLLKSKAQPLVAPSVQFDYEIPFRQPFSAYGWEDGINISRNGLNLYALYYPGDLLSWTIFSGRNVSGGDFCKLFGNNDYVRSYTDQYGMDMTTNSYGCSSFVNTDILYAKRNSEGEQFSEWNLSGLAIPGATEGGAYPVFSESDSGLIEIFLYTNLNSIWMIRNVSSDLKNSGSAVRLPSPVNPVSNEFQADNPHLERLSVDTLLLFYEKYTDGEKRTFMYSFSYDNGLNWTTPSAVSTINFTQGKIEHPHLYKGKSGLWYLYFSLDCEIYRSRQGTENNWDSWQKPELIISKGNLPCIGEPSLTENGDISFAVVYPPNYENYDSTDVYDIDPWFLKKKNTVAGNLDKSTDTEIRIFPNPCSEKLYVASSSEITEVRIFNLSGENILRKKVNGFTADIDIVLLPEGIYFAGIYCREHVSLKKIFRK
jgi:hypothetical protein